jgi:hypothetical protein
MVGSESGIDAQKRKGLLLQILGRGLVVHDGKKEECFGAKEKNREMGVITKILEAREAQGVRNVLQ